MSINKVCLNCGSSDFVSDRSLGGRMICSKCGSTTFGNKSLSPFRNKKIIYLLIGIVIFIIVVI